MNAGVRLLADDLTGALDAAVRLARLAGELPVLWDVQAALRCTGSIALTSGTREQDPRAAQQAVREIMRFWRDDALSFKKIDSLWRGNTVAEIAVLAKARRFSTVVIASAFPEQQRMTRGGQPYHRASPDTSWVPVTDDIVAGLSFHDVAPSIVQTGAAISLAKGGVWLFDAETDKDLDAVVRMGMSAKPPVLWCGSAGLAGALAGSAPAPPAAAGFELPAAIVVGSSHPASREQVEALKAYAKVFEVHDDEAAWPELIMRANDALLGGGSVIFWHSPHVKLPDHVSRRMMAKFFALVGRSLRPPGVVFVAGGETLQQMCEALGATRLRPIREINPGVPLSKISGGRWSGRNLISKSGAFGDRNLIVRILESGKSR